jgi:hypothetical protein
MRDHDYDRADEEDRLHFIQCTVCGQWFDCRDLAEVIAHHEHEVPRPAGVGTEIAKDDV